MTEDRIGKEISGSMHRRFPSRKRGPIQYGWVLFSNSCQRKVVCEMFTDVIINPSVQEYVAGQGNIKGNVPVEEYISISEDFAIGADKNGYAVFKDPVKALDKLMELYSDGINLIQKSFELESLSADNCGDYKVYGSQTTAGTEREQQQALFAAKFHDIYENSYVRQYPNLHSGEQQKNICRLVQ